MSIGVPMRRDVAANVNVGRLLSSHDSLRLRVANKMNSSYVIPSDSFNWNWVGLRLFGEELATRNLRPLPSVIWDALDSSLRSASFSDESESEDIPFKESDRMTFC